MVVIKKNISIFIGMITKSDYTNFKIIIFSALFAIGTAFSQSAEAQQMRVVHTEVFYRQQVKADSNFLMVELKSNIPSLIYDIKYATTHNFTGTQLYQKGNKTFLRLPAARALNAVQNNLAQKGYGLKIWDAYRPYRATQAMWNLIQDERYVANPAKGSGHNRGLAVDVTIIDLATGAELDMGTAYDHFTDTAHHSFQQLSTTVLQNRALLKTTMEKAGFAALSTEWWHYSWPNDRAYDVMDFSFDQLTQMNKKLKRKKRRFE
ncbi:MAG: M15 family metallopeptidase [Chitinophagaceae bacterium]